MALAVCLCLWKFPSATGCFRGHLKPWIPDWWEQIRWDEVEGDAVRAGTLEQVCPPFVRGFVAYFLRSQSGRQDSNLRPSASKAVPLMQ